MGVCAEKSAHKGSCNVNAKILHQLPPLSSAGAYDTVETPMIVTTM
jgi:hypothetical protein